MSIVRVCCCFGFGMVDRLRRMLVCINGVCNEDDDDSIGDGLGLDIDDAFATDEVNMLRVLIASRDMREVSDWAIVLDSCRLLFC